MAEEESMNSLTDNGHVIGRGIAVDKRRYEKVELYWTCKLDDTTAFLVKLTGFNAPMKKEALSIFRALVVSIYYMADRHGGYRVERVYSFFFYSLLTIGVQRLYHPDHPN